MMTSNVRLWSEHRVGFMCARKQISRVSVAIKYASECYIYRAATIEDMELSSAQCLLFSLVHGLITGDVSFCISLMAACHGLPQLRSSYLRVWLRDDFVFDARDVKRGLSLLSKLLADDVLELPSYVTGTLSALGQKYGIGGLCFTSTSQDSSINMDKKLKKAIANSRVEDIIALSVKGGNINLNTEGGDSLLHLAVSSECVGSIMALGYLKADMDPLDRTLKTPLHRAVEEDRGSVVKALLVSGANPSKRIRGGDTMDHLAAGGGFNDALKALIEGGVDLKERNHCGETALAKAVRANNVTGVQIILESEGIAGEADGGMKLLEMAINTKNLEMVKVLINGGATVTGITENGETLLHMAARCRDVGLVKVLIQAGAPLNLKDKDGLEPLHVSSDEDIIRLLVRSGVNINSKTTGGNTCLHLAVSSGAINILTTLLPLGADVDAKDSNGNTSLFLAARNSKCDTVKMLLNEGADPNIKNNAGQTPLHQAAADGCTEIADALISAGAIVDVKDNEELTPAHRATIAGKLPVLQLLERKGADIKSKCNNGFALIHYAAYNGFADVVRWLLDAGIGLEDKSDRK